MKNVLMGASALALVAGGAAAQEWTTNVGGFMTLGAGYVDNDAHLAELELVNNAEVIFNFRLVADNGLTFGAKVEFEANGSSNNADEYVGFVSGSFGRLEIGVEDGAGDRLAGAAAGNTAFTAAADAAGFLFDYAATDVGVVSTDGGDTGDQFKITYFTPVFSGFQAGVSYTPGSEGGTSSDGTDVAGEGFEIGAAYGGEFGDFSVDIGAAYLDNTSDNPSVTVDNAFIVSANVGFGGFTVGGIYGQQDLEMGDDAGGFGVGANYATGPWNFGLQYAQGIEDDDDLMGISAGVDYALAPGVTAGAVVEYAEDDLPAGQDEEAFAVGAFLGLDF
jgi:predicted porin